MHTLRSNRRGRKSGSCWATLWVFWIFLFTGSLLFAQEDSESVLPRQASPDWPDLDTEALAREITEEARSELMSLTIRDTEVSLFLAGFWKATLTGNLGFALTPLGPTIVSSDSPVLFTQETDLSLSLWIREKWFVEANVLDEYTLNTYRAGYQGAAGEPVQYVGIGNTGLDYPSFPYLDLGGDSPYTFGAYGRFGSGDFTLHSVIRYDAASQEERVFVGSRERTYSILPLPSMERGLSFVLPQENIRDTPVVYLETPQGDLRGSDGRRWKRAGPGDFAASARYGMVVLSDAPVGRVAVFYPGIDMGAYGGAGFLAEVQGFFPDTALTAYPQCGQDDPAMLGRNDNAPGMVAIYEGAQGRNALIIYEKGAFSPFERQNQYTAPTSNSASASLVQLRSGDAVDGYELRVAEPLSRAPSALPESPAASTRELFELVKTGIATEPRAPANRWPLGDLYPQLYLPGATSFNEDVGIRFTNYGGADGYAIGTDVVPGSVQVFRGGLVDSNFTYNSSSGYVNLANPPLLNEIITIRYLKKSEDRQFGSLAAGIGAVYDPPGPFLGELGLGLRWNVTTDSYSEEGKTSPGTVGIGARAALDLDALQAQATVGLGFEQPDSAGLYRGVGMEGSEYLLSMPISLATLAAPPADYTTADLSFAALDQSSRADLIYRNYQNSTILGSSLDRIDSGGSLISGRQGPYPALDPRLSSSEALLVAEFEFTPLKTWTGFQFPLGVDGESLAQAREIDIPFRFYGMDSADPLHLRVIIQFGALGDEDSQGQENPSLIASREIYPSNNSAESEYRNLGKFILSDEDRRKLENARYARILVLSDGTPLSGRVLLAPPIVRGAQFRPILVQNGSIAAAPISASLKSVNAVERIDRELTEKYRSRINALHPGSAIQRVLEVSWRNLDFGDAPGADGRIGELPLSSYKTLRFFFKAPTGLGSPNDALRFVIAEGPQSLGKDREIVLEARIPLAGFTPGAWSSVELHYGGGRNSITRDGEAIPDSRLIYRPAAAQRRDSWDSSSTSYLAAFIESASTLPDGSFSLDEVVLEESAPFYRANAGAGVEWSRPGVLLSYGSMPILEAPILRTAVETLGEGDPFTNPDAQPYYGVVNRSVGEATLLGARLMGNIALSALSESLYWQGGHEISRSWGPFSAKEEFSLSPSEETLTHRFDFNLRTRLHSRFTGEATVEHATQERSWEASLGIDPRPLGASITGKAKLGSREEAPSWMDNYAEAWALSYRPLLPDLGEKSQSRDIQGLFILPLLLRPVGFTLTAEGLSGFSAIHNRTSAETLGRMDFPFTVGGFQGYLRGERRFNRSIFYTGTDALADGQRYYESLWDSRMLWVSAPFYSLFAPGQADLLEDGIRDSRTGSLNEYSLFADTVQATLELPRSYGSPLLGSADSSGPGGRLFWLSFLPPRSIELSLSRNLEKKLDTSTDVLTIRSALGFSLVNLFGAFGYFPLFSFYMSDEFNHRIEGAFSIPRDDPFSYRIQDEVGLHFYGFTGGELNALNIATVRSDSFTDSLAITWTAPAPRSLLGYGYLWLADRVRNRNTWPALSDLAESSFERLRRETLEFVIQTTETSRTISVILGHESIIRILGRLYLGVFANLGAEQDLTAEIYAFTASIGTTLNVSF